MLMMKDLPTIYLVTVIVMFLSVLARTISVTDTYVEMHAKSGLGTEAFTNLCRHLE